MSLKMKIDTFTAADVTETTEVHLMPCKIDYNGPAKVKQYFSPVVTSTSTGDSETLTASFRGRPLEGQKLSFPKGYIGLVLKEFTNDAPVDGDDERQLAVTHKFRNFTYWNLDSTPGADDKIAQVMKWIDISQAIHQSPTGVN